MGRLRTRVLSAALGATLGGCGCPGSPAVPAPLPVAPVEAPETVVLVVIDTLRSDHVSACGGPAALTPTLDAWAADHHATLACDGWSSGTWTHPSHASLFTGTPVHEHGALWAREGGTEINPVTRVHPLGPDATTLAERFREAGYRTVAVSANPILMAESGLLQGFDDTRIAQAVHGFRGDHLARPLLGALGAVPSDTPLFLFVNVYDAHDPWPAVPEGRSWGAAQPAIDLQPNTDLDTPYRRFLQGTHADPDAYVRTIRSAYAEGVHAADATLAMVRTAVHRMRGQDAAIRWVVTSDHGELLGEHGLLRHGGFLWEPAIRIPAMWVEPGATPTLPEPFVLDALHDVILHGRAPARAPLSASEPNPDDLRVGGLGIATREGAIKRVRSQDHSLRYDLDADPAEIAPTPAEPDALQHPWDALNQRWRAGGIPSEALEAVGYVAPDDGSGR